MIASTTLALILLDVIIPHLPTVHRVDYYSPDLLYNHQIHGWQSVPDSSGYYERADFINLIRYNNYGRHDNHVYAKKEEKRISHYDLVFAKLSVHANLYKSLLAHFT